MRSALAKVVVQEHRGPMPTAPLQPGLTATFMVKGYPVHVTPDRASFFGETQMVDFARISRRSRGRYWVRSGLIPSRAKALVWSGVGRA